VWRSLSCGPMRGVAGPPNLPEAARLTGDVTKSVKSVKRVKPPPMCTARLPYWAFNLIDLNFDNSAQRQPPAFFLDLVVRIC
jgi:hypothetical protein